jgi:hypothetical protein
MRSMATGSCPGFACIPTAAGRPPFDASSSGRPAPSSGCRNGRRLAEHPGLNRLQPRPAEPRADPTPALPPADAQLARHHGRIGACRCCAGQRTPARCPSALAWPPCAWARRPAARPSRRPAFRTLLTQRDMPSSAHIQTSSASSDCALHSQTGLPWRAACSGGRPAAARALPPGTTRIGVCRLQTRRWRSGRQAT